MCSFSFFCSLCCHHYGSLIRDIKTLKSDEWKIKEKEKKIDRFIIKNLRIKSNQIKSNQIKSNQIKSNQIKSNQIKSNQIKSNQIKSNRIESIGIQIVMER